MEDRQKAMLWWHSLSKRAQAMLHNTATGREIEDKWRELKVQPAVTAPPLSEDEGKTAERILKNHFNKTVKLAGYSFEEASENNGYDWIYEAMKEYALQFQKSDEGNKTFSVEAAADLLKWRELMRGTGILIGLSEADIVKKYLSLTK